MCKLNCYTHTECGCIHHEVITKRCAGSRIEIDGRTSCSFGTDCIMVTYDGRPFCANCYLAKYVEITRYYEKYELEAIESAISHNKPLEFLMGLREHYASERREAIRWLNEKQGV